jgi:hypothetical protein
VKEAINLVIVMAVAGGWLCFVFFDKMEKMTRGKD